MKTLVKYHPFFTCTRDVPSNTFTVTGEFTMVPGVTGNNYALAYHETYFDLAGLTMDDKTLFFDAADVQQTLLPTWSGATIPGDKVTVWDIMSSVPIVIDDKLTADIVYNFGYPGSRQTFNEIIYARVEQYVTTQDVGTFGSPVKVNSQNYSSGMPTASDRIYSYRFVEVAVASAASPITACVVTPPRHILSASAKEEPDHEYMMRLLRSYQLQQEPDVD